MTYDATEILTTMRRLTPDRLKEARLGAISMTLAEFGLKPKRDDFERKSKDADFNQRLFRMIIGITISAAAISIFRTFSAGRQHYMATTGVWWQSWIAGLSMFVMAELAMIVFANAANRLFKGRKWYQATLYFLTAVAGSIAIVGNVIIAQPSFVEFSVGNVWAWIETLSPTIFTVASVFVLGAIEESRGESEALNHNEFTTALAAWKKQTAKPESLPGFRLNFEQEIKDALVTHNSQRGGKNQALRFEMVATMNAQEWQIVIDRELPSSMITGENAPTASPKSQAGSAFSQPPSPLPLPTSEQK